MILGMYSVYDVLAGTFGVPFFSQNEAMAKRSFQHLVNDEQSVVNKSPADFYLYEVGHFDDTDGSVENTNNNHLVAKAIDLVQRS